MTKDECLELLNDYYDLPTHGTGFWVSYPKRALEEISKLQESTRAILDHDASKMILKERIVNNYGCYFNILIEVPAGYPFNAPETFVKSSGINIRKAKHMYSGNRLCLFHPSEYNSSMSILSIRNLAAAWCFAAYVFVKTGEWPAAEAH